MRDFKKLENRTTSGFQTMGRGVALLGRLRLGFGPLTDEKVSKHAGFTLAEVLITLAIVGVVAALTIPALVQNISDRAKKAQKDTIEARLLEGYYRDQRWLCINTC